MRRLLNKRRRTAATAIGATLLVLLLMFSSVMPAAAATAVDAPTHDSWSIKTGDDTQNIGRIWTDKTVFVDDVTLPPSATGVTPKVEIGSSEFLVALSALSSAGQIIGGDNKPMPLDIVIVMDGTKNLVDQEGGGQLNAFELQQQTVKNFIDQIAEVNSEAENGQSMYRVAVTHSASQGSTEGTDGFIPCTGTGVDQLKSEIDRIPSQSSFNPTKGFERVNENYMDARRNDAQTIVVVFGSAQHSGGNTFNDKNANDAFPGVKIVKETGAIIYTVGTFSNANNANPPAADANPFNQFMHTVSSNYPNAGSYNDFSEPAKDHKGDYTKYYKTADNAVELEAVFQEIFQEIMRIEATSPTADGVLGGENTAITFHDELGAYMGVDDFKAIVFADKVFTQHTESTTTANGVTTKVCHFSGKADLDDEGNGIYPAGDIDSITLTVESHDDLKMGDKITVKIPADMIPLRYYDVEVIDGKVTMSIDEAFPLRIFYGASVKDGVEELIARPDDAMKSYIDKNKTEDGKVRFFANKYNANDENHGGVYAEFKPNEKNEFYYFQEDTKLYEDNQFATLAKGPIDENKTYYYPRTYYSMEDEKVLTRTVEIKGSDNEMLKGVVKTDLQGNLYIEEGTARVTGINDFVFLKTAPLKDTAPYIIKPEWDNVNTPETVYASLGNNGVVTRELPGELSVSKIVTSQEGFTAHDEEFGFTLSLTSPQGGALEATYQAVKVDAEGNEEDLEIATTTALPYTFELKADESLYVYGLKAGTGYTVTEVADQIPAGFELESSADDNGTIAAGASKDAVFTNHYEVDELIVHADEFGLSGTKTLDGREFKDGDIFKFIIEPSQQTPNAPLPEPNAVTINPKSGYTEDFTFGNDTFTFTKAGEYRYGIYEYLPNNEKVDEDPADKIIPFVTYDTTEYRLIVKVKDDGAGQLTIENIEIAKHDSALDTTWDVLYTGTDFPGTNEHYLNFKNVYDEKSQEISLNGRKTLSNKSIGDYPEKEQFKFNIAYGGSRDIGETDFNTNDTFGGTVPMPDVTTVMSSTTGHFSMGPIEFTDVHVNKEFKYVITEAQPTEDGTYNGTKLEGAVKNSAGQWVYKGVTFDKTSKEVIVKVETEGEVGNQTLKTTITGNNDLIFNNTYSVEKDFTLTGTKTITGRDFTPGEAFTFNIAAQNNAPMPKDAQGQDVSTFTLNPTDANSEPIAFDFGTIHFTKADMMGAIRNVDAAGRASYTKDFTYIITEAKGSDPNMIYD